MQHLIPLTFLLALPAQAQDPAAELGGGRSLSILYAGHLESPRATRYVDFLKEWFAKVDAIDLHDLNAKTARPHDVVVADLRRRYGDGGSFDSDSGHRANIAEDFSKPVIMIGAVGGELARGGKIDWL